MLHYITQSSKNSSQGGEVEHQQYEYRDDGKPVFGLDKAGYFTMQ